MRIAVLVLSTLVLGVSACQSANPVPEARSIGVPTSGNEVVNRTLIIQHSGNPAPILDAARTMDSEVVYNLQNISAVVVRIPEGADVQHAMSAYEAVEGVVGVMQDQIITLD